jgi:predicted nucleic acid-binding protein
VIILDTNLISEAMKIMPARQVQAWLDAQPGASLYSTAINVAELQFGLAILPAGRRRQFLQNRFDAAILPLFAGRLLAFDVDAAHAYAGLMARARIEGQAIEQPDGFIAAIAMTRGYAVATRDVAPFIAAGVTVIDPWADP